MSSLIKRSFTRRSVAAHLCKIAKITASNGSDPCQGLLNSDGWWEPFTDDRNQMIAYTFPEAMTVTHVQIQGRPYIDGEIFDCRVT